MDSSTWHTGDDDFVLVTIEDYDPDTDTWTARNIASGATVTAVWHRAGTKVAPTNASSFTCASNTAGADWTNGIVSIPVVAANTSAIAASTPKDVFIEVKIVESSLTKRYTTPADQTIRIRKSVH